MLPSQLAYLVECSVTPIPCVLPGGHGSAGETEAAVCRAAS